MIIFDMIITNLSFFFFQKKKKWYGIHQLHPIIFKKF